MSGPIATTANEMPVYFPAGDEELFGILTRPTVEPNGIGVVLLSGGAWTPSPGRNRIWVRMARQLAARGFHTLRFDYHGVGESTGEIDTYVLHRPFVDDLRGAVRVLREHGLEQFVLMGTCFGSRTALAGAADVEGLRGVAVFPVPVRDFKAGERLESLPVSWYVRKLFSRQVLTRILRADRRREYAQVARKKARWALDTTQDTREQRADFHWVSPSIVDQLSGLVDRDVPVLLLFGDEDDFYADFQRGLPGPVGRVLDRAGELVTLSLVPGKVHGLATSWGQEAVLDRVDEWLSRVTAPDTPEPTGAVAQG
jgi:pimeloyl-ACP methyl ester carboxylesterase